MKIFCARGTIFSLVLFFVFFAGSGFLSAAEIEIGNLKEGENVGYELLLVRGSLSGVADSVTVSSFGSSQSWPVVNGQYKALVLLEKGRNDIRLEAAGHSAKQLRINYQPKKRGDTVRMVYVVASDGDDRFQAPAGESGDLESAKRKLAFAGLLMQTATAELMNNAGYGRKTFRLQRDSSGEVDVEIFRSKLSMRKAHGMTGLEIWRSLYRELDGLGGRSRKMAVMQMTRFDKAQQKAYAHTALGGSSLALMGSGSMHTWAENLDELVDCFSDERRVGNFGMFDDSAYRRTFWANYSTSLGACLHELGHSFGLNHSGDNKGIMERGFDRINRLFMSTEGGRVYEDEDIRWSPESARELSNGRWLN